MVAEIFRSSCAASDTGPGDFPDTFILPRRGWLHVYIQLQFYRLSVRHFILLSGCYLRPHVRFLACARERERAKGRKRESIKPKLLSLWDDADSSWWFFRLYYCTVKCYKLRQKMKEISGTDDRKMHSHKWAPYKSSIIVKFLYFILFYFSLHCDMNTRRRIKPFGYLIPRNSTSAFRLHFYI